VIVQRWKGSAFGSSQRPNEAGGSRAREVPGEVGAAPTTTGRSGTARRGGPGKRDGQVYVCRNQWLNPLKWNDGSNLVDMGRSAVHTRVTSVVRVTLGSVLGLAGSEATVKVCGVTVARLQGKSWAPIPSNEHVVNVGTISGSPSPPTGQVDGGQTHRQLTSPGWGGVAVVVRDRESRSHGQGRQRVRGCGTGRSGGRR
jgi:hypothetical protein